MNRKKIKDAIKMILEAVGEDPGREGLKGTPERIASMYEEVLAGYSDNPRKHLKVLYEQENYEEIILVRDIPVYSICEHHLMPFFGKAHVVYIPNKNKIVGVSKLVRVMDVYARRLQIQERLTTQVANIIMKELKAQGVMVVIEAEHFCMTMRGVKKPGSKMITSAVRGVFYKDAKARSEAMALISNKQQ